MKKLIILTLALIFLIGFSQSAQTRAKDPNDTSGITSEDAQNIKTAVENHGTTIANMQNEINEVVKNNQTMNGDIGRTFKSVRDQEKVITDLTTRLQTLEDKMSILTGQMQELHTEGLVSPQASKRLTEYKKFSKNLEFINAGQYDQAVKSLQQFLTENPGSTAANYAQFWIGEAYYMQSDYPMAIKQYQELLAKNPNSEKASLAMYRQGLSFYHLQSFDDAKAFFTKVIRTYPQSIEAVLASAQIKRIDNIQELKRQQELEMKMVN